METKNKGRNISFCYFIIIIFVLLCSCKESEKRLIIRQILKEWRGKTIIFPEDITCKVMGRDTVATDLFQKPYKILLYVDTVGCTSCKLQMLEWKKIIMEADSIAPNQIGFLFFFYPKNPEELDILMIRTRFNYPVFIDERNAIDSLNHFPKDMTFQSFLLDQDNKVLGVGNPSFNPKIWKLYKHLITVTRQKEKTAKTSVKVLESNMKISGMEVGKVSQVIFVLKNTGFSHLIISDIKSSCGCTVPDWDKSPIAPQKDAEIRVEIKPEEPGYFNKTIDVYCNIKQSPLKLTISGTVSK